jgi:4-hydroxy-tetrahydrodipicolinate reductase
LILEAAGGRRAKAAMALEGALPDDRFHVSAVRAGGIVGEHTVGFDSGGDEILLEHRARSRRGFAEGAVIAAEWIATRTGVYEFAAVLDDLARG